MLPADLIWTSPRIEQYDEEAEHTQRLELDSMKESELILPYNLLAISKA
jgi:hypothetical protein